MASAVIGALRVNLGIDSAEFDKGLKSAKDGLAQMASAAKLAGAAIAAAFAAGIGAAVVRVGQMGVASRKLDQALKNAGNAAKTSAAEVAAWADKLERRTGRAVEEVMAVGANLASFNFGEEVFFRAIELADDMAAAWGGDLRGNLEGLSRALDDPVNGFAMLRKRGIALTDAQAALVESLMKSNDKLGAQKVVLEALEGQVKGVAEAGYQGMTKALGNLTAAMDGFFDRIVESVGGGNLLAGAIDRVTAAIDYLTENIHQVAIVAAIVGTGLATAFAPAITALIWSMATAMTTGVLAGLTAIKAALLANPFTALVLGITAAITAAYAFRDEIQKAIGIDVIGIVKDAANMIIGSFVAAYEDIKFVWSQLPNMVGAAAIGAANVTISTIAKMVNSAIEGINAVVAAIPSWLGGGGEGIGFRMDERDRWTNTFRDELKRAVGDRSRAIADALSTDYIGAIGRAFEGSTPAVQNFGAALGNVGDEMDDISGGGAKGGRGGKASKVKDAVDKVAQAMQSAKESLGQGFGAIFDGLLNKTMSWRDAIMQAGRELLKYLNQANMAQGGKGLFGGGFLQGLLGSFLGFASGGTIFPGGTGGVDSQLVAFRKSPNERVDITKPGQTLRSGPQEIIVRGVFVDDGGVVTGIAEGSSARAAGKVAGAVPSMVDSRSNEKQVRRIRPGGSF